MKVPAAITDFYITQRDKFLEKKGTKNSKAAASLYDAMRQDDSSPSSSQNSNLSFKRGRSEDPLQPSIVQSMVSLSTRSLMFVVPSNLDVVQDLAKTAKLNIGILHFLAECGIPPSIVDSPAFKEMMLV